MISELEKQFFAKFGIEPKKGCTAYDKFTEEEADAICSDKCAECSYLDDVYPKITDHILLELLCIAHTSPVITFVSRDVKSLKEEVLMVLCNWINNRNIKQQVRALFKEYNNDR